ncbi:MAG: peptidyl-tRNA hydrolase, partial [Polyangiaceae bacterium]|nr:peptidyl-tRNA hydrolase [Polyangiaceae bacterium]
GQSVQPAAAFFKAPPAQIIVLHDEIDIPFGELRLKVGGGHAGHNGIRSVTQSMGTPDFVRLRIGVGRPPPGFRGEVADFVLSSFDAMERAELPGILKRGAESVLDVLARGVTAATNKLNTKPKPNPRSGADADKPSSEKASSEKKTASSGSGAASPRGKA